MSVRLYLPLCCGRTAPEVIEEEGSYASHFYHWFLESFKSCLLLLVALSSLIDTLAQLLAWRFLLWLSMTWRRRYLSQNHFLSTILTAYLWHYIYCFSVRRSLYGGRKYTHTHTHTYTYTYTHTHMISSNPVRFSAEILFSSLVSFAFCLLFFFFWNVYSDTNLIMQAGEWEKNFLSADFWKQDYFFWSKTSAWTEKASRKTPQSSRGVL